MNIAPSILAKARSWTSESYDTPTRQEVEKLLAEGGEALVDAFYKDLDFGTGGLRGIMGAGSNRINRYTLGMATQGLCNYLKKQFPFEQIKVAIAYDCRNNSQHFSKEVASVFAANDIQVFLFEELRPTPALSFAIRHLNCHSGVVITASHNPPEYNGYKVYWNDGGQLVPPHDKAVIEEVRKVRVEDVHFDTTSDLIYAIGLEVDKAYLEEVKKRSLSNKGKEELSIVFTPIHGTSITLLPQALSNAGFTQVHIVDEQSTPDGNFPTVLSPNPEEAEALSMAVSKAESMGADLVIGTDPDADRVGLAVRGLDGKMQLINGNQAATALLYYLLEQHQAQGKLSGNEFVAKTIVTTDLLDLIAASFKVPCPNCLTGFKWIAELIREREGKLKFIGGGEESYGYMIGDFVRDKDAIASGMMLAEVAAYAKARGKSFMEYLIDIYVKYGFYKESLVSITRKGKSGAEEIAAMMEQFRTNPPATLGGEQVIQLYDYQTGISTNLSNGLESSIGLPASNVIQFITDKGSKVTARPSGTEPKIKFYFSVNAPLQDKADFNTVAQQLDAQIERLKADLK
jgi:phosphoglucomutase